MRASFFIFSFVLLIGICSSVSADDWPHWMGPKMDGVWNEGGIIEKFNDSKAKILWRQPIGGGYAGPSILGNRIYVMDRTKDDKKGVTVENNIRSVGEIPGGERVLCLDLRTGETIWEQAYESGYKIAYPNGPRCSIAIDGQHVYSLGAMGRLMCLEANDGTVVWKKDLVEEFKTRPPPWGYSSHPLIDGKKVIVPVGGEGTGLVAFDKETGKELWRSVTTIDIGYAPLVIYEGSTESGEKNKQLIFWHGAGVTGLDPETGKEFWYVKFPEDPSPSITTIATPVLFEDGKLLISEFYKGSLLLQLSFHPPAAKEVWRSHKDDPRNKESLNSMMTTPIVKDGHAYGIAYDGRGHGVFRCIDLTSGKAKWTQQDWLAEKPIMFATAFGVSNEGRYFLFSDTGELLIAEMDTAGYREISRAKIIEPTSAARGRKVVWCHPAFADRKMVVRNDEEIVCVDLAK